MSDSLFPFEAMVDDAVRMGAVMSRRLSGRAYIGEGLVIALAAIDSLAMGADDLTAAQVKRKSPGVDDDTVLVALAIRCLSGAIEPPKGELRPVLATKGVLPGGKFKSLVRARTSELTW